jgi:hypothetical protein
MKLFRPVLTFASTLLLAMFVYAYTAIKFPVTMRDLLLSANHVRDQVADSFAGDVAAWITITFVPSQVVFLCFALGVHAMVEGIRCLLKRLRGRKPPDDTAGRRRRQPFSRWG